MLFNIIKYIIFIVLCGNAYAFKPDHTFITSKSLKGCDDPSGCHHKGITRNALKGITSSINGEVVNFTEKAIEEVAQANSSVDDLTKEFYNSVAHCDNEKIVECSQRIKIFREDIIRLLKKQIPSGKDARKLLGRALHTIQDYYAHSNWVDKWDNFALGQKINPRLTSGNINPPLKNSVVCEDDFGTITEADGFGPSNTSGYFPSTLAVAIVNIHDATKKGKCSHGKDRKDDPGINKDAVARPLHKEARLSAIEASRQYVLSIINEDGIKNNSGALRALMKLDGDMGFAVDITASMKQEISGVKKSIEKLVKDESGVSTFDKFVLVTFDDPDKGTLREKTKFQNKFINEINNITLIPGNPDCPEFSLSGIQTTLNNVNDSSQIFVYTDASPKDPELKNSIIAQASKKEVSVIFILTGTCSPIHEAYIDIAEETGGQVFLINKSEVEDLDVLIQPIVNGDRYLMLSVSDFNISSDARLISVPIDSSLDLLTISTTVDTGVSITLIRPDGSSVSNTEPNVKIVHLSSGSIFQIKNPVAGEWIIKRTGNGKMDISVFGNSTIGLTDVEFVEIKGRPLHKAFFPIDGLPVDNGDIYFHGTINNARSVVYQLRNERGDVIRQIPVESTEKIGTTAYRYFVKMNSLPNQSFRIYATGVDLKGYKFVRAFPTIFTKQSVLVTPKISALSASMNSTQEILFNVTNLGNHDIFNISASSSDGTLVDLSTRSVELNKSKKMKIKATLDVPVIASEQSVIDITLLAESASDPRIKNSAIVTISIDNSKPIIENQTATLTVSPTTPTSKDSITVTASGEWNNGCAPTSMTLDSTSGNTTRLRLNPDFSSSDICLQVITPWSISTNVGILPQGTHTLEVFRVIDNTEQVLGTSSVSVQQPPVVVEPPPPTTEPPAVSTQSFTSTMVAMHSDKCLDINANSKKNGANAHQFRCHGNDNQSFVFTPVDGKDDVYTITAKHSGKCLDVEGVSLDTGASILQWSCGSNTPNQQFTLKSVGTKVFQIKPVHSGQCLDVFGNKTTDDANVIQWTCKENKPNQQWQVNGYQ